MLYSFLTSDDLDVAIKDEQLYQLVRDDLTLIARAEAAAVSWMQDHLGQRFDLPNVFGGIGEWSAAHAYAPALPASVLIEGQSVVYLPTYDRNAVGRVTNYAWHAGFWYEALTPSIGVEPGNLEANLYWEDSWRERDPRDAKLVGYCVDIALFLLHKRVAPRKIPTFRIDMYNLAKEWLEQVRDGLLTPNLAQHIRPSESSDTIRWGSNYPVTHYY
ncbi:hypothetical protein [Hymenobacter rubripertinctus]|uniref:DUF1320 domain-containing protein n=1 Tax=Hymenobacter rubripertinctus TaxID=2029981 RepID=A0A418QMV4_9BACT|nr:hypothetical protein [Hymenobacter rubripertinctus]RIY06472.1 hypothetical protein D0T11_18705 [Hymenobacter rubripertinctus]